MTEANLRGARFGYDTHFEMPPGHHDLRDAIFRNADLTGAFLHHCDLRGADFRGADLQMANLADANLAGADLRGANLLYATLTEATLTDEDGTNPAILDETTKLPDNNWCKLQEAKRRKSEETRHHIFEWKRELRKIDPRDRGAKLKALAQLDEEHKKLLRDAETYTQLRPFLEEKRYPTPSIPYYTDTYLFLDAFSRRQCQKMPPWHEFFASVYSVYIDWDEVEKMQPKYQRKG